MRRQIRPSGETVSEFQNNLRLLCSYYSSIADVCRRLGINRQQFNKYLSGDASPSRHNLLRICEFFGVNEQDLTLPERRFREIINSSQSDKEQKPKFYNHIHGLDSILPNGQVNLQPYGGYYHSYYPSGGQEGHIIRALLFVGRNNDGSYYTKRISTYHLVESGRKFKVLYRYLGFPILLGERLYIYEYDTFGRDILTTTILYGAFRNRVDVLIGLQMGVAGRRSLEPAAGNVVLQYLGREISIRKALAECGIFHWQSGKIPDWVIQRLQNREVNAFLWRIPEQ
jgi:transcriptional regulator with XRE-family HTH domain